MLSMILMVLMIMIMFKICFWTIGFFGRMIGSLFGCMLYIVIGVIGLAVFGFGLIIVPVIIIAGVCSILYAITKVV